MRIFNMDQKSRQNFGINSEIKKIMEFKNSNYFKLNENIRNFNYDFLYMYDRKGRVTFASYGGALALGLKPHEVVGKTWTDLGLPSEVIEAFNLQLEVVFKTGRPLISENKFPTIEGEKDIEYILYPRKDRNGYIESVECTVKDITERKHKEEELKKKMMKYRWEDGRIYIVKEPQAARSIQAFNELLKFGYKGLVISRNTKNNFNKNNIGINYEFIWLTEKNTNNNLDDVINKIEDSGNKNVILIERLEYLILKKGFKKTLTFIQLINDISYIMNDIVIIAIDPSILNDKELRLLEKECLALTTRVNKDKLPLKVIKVLKYIYQENIKGIKPSYSDIGQELFMSKPTVRKFIRSLIKNGHLKEYISGRKKNIEITDNGRNILLD
jgi:PAS domain S-box-containing protein